ncbi:unnamed protein product, partial [Brenthis ino]
MWLRLVVTAHITSDDDAAKTIHVKIVHKNKQTSIQLVFMFMSYASEYIERLGNIPRNRRGMSARPVAGAVGHVQLQLKDRNIAKLPKC